MIHVKTPAQNRQPGNPFQPRLTDDQGFLLGSSLVAMMLAGFVLLGLAYIGAFA